MEDMARIRKITSPWGFENIRRTKAEYRFCKSVLEREAQSLAELIDDMEKHHGFAREDWYERRGACLYAISYCEFALASSAEEDELF